MNSTEQATESALHPDTEGFPTRRDLLSAEGRGASSRAPLAFPLVLAVAVVSLAFFAPCAAQGATTHEFLPEPSKRISEGVPAGTKVGSEEALTGPLGGVNAMTLDSGHLWVAEGIEGVGTRVDEFDASTGAFLSQLPQEPGLTETDQGIAVGHVGAGKEEQVYVGASGGKQLTEQKHESVVAVFGPSGSLQATWTGADTPNKSFVAHENESHEVERAAELTGVAVDNKETTSGEDWAAGDVYVATASILSTEVSLNVVDVFKPEADGKEKYVTQLTGTCEAPGTCAGLVVPFGGPRGVTVDQFNGDVLVQDAEFVEGEYRAVVDVFAPTGIDEYSFVRQIKETPSGPFEKGLSKLEGAGVVVDGGEGPDRGDIYVPEPTLGVVYQFNATGEFLDSLSGTPAGPFGAHSLGGVAVDPEGHHVFVGDHNRETNGGVVDAYGGDAVVPDVTVEPVSHRTATSATLHGTVNPVKAGEATCHFEYGTTTAYGKTAECAGQGSKATPIPDVEAAVPVESEPVDGLLPDTTYHYRLDATNENGTNSGQGPEGPQDLGEFTTLGPGIHSESVSSVASTSATFEATINPHNTPSTSPTTYYFQYGETTGYGQDAPVLTGLEPHGGVVGSGEGDVQVSQHVQVGLTPGMVYHYRVVAVSEPERGEFEEFDGPDQTFTTQIAASFILPDGRAWEMVSSPDKHGADLISPTEGAYAFQAAVSGDAVTYVALSPTEADPQGFSNVMQLLSTRGPEGWGSKDIGVPHVQDTGVATVTEYPLFSSDLSLAAVAPFGVFDPTISSEASENTPYLRTDFPGGNVAARCEDSCYRPLVTGKAGFANVPPGTVFGGEAEQICRGRCGPEFLGGTPDLSHVVLKSAVALTKTAVKRGLYEWAAGGLQLLSVLPASEGGGAVAGSLGNPREMAARAGTISNDGSRVVWAATVEVAGKSEEHLYTSNTATGVTKTVRLDVAEPGCHSCSGGVAEPKFQVASSGGSKVLFTDTQRLTEDAGAGANEPDLYECEIVEAKGGELECRLSDLTPFSSGEPADVQAGGPGASQGAVVGASEDGSWVYFVAYGVLAAGAERGQPNLYVAHAGSTRLVAVLSPADSPDWAGQIGSIDGISARVSPDGEWLAFMSQRSLTGYDQRDAISGKPDEEVYLYDASSERLVCASCDPTGARPSGEVFGTDSSRLEEAFLGGNRAWENAGTSLAALIPGWTRELYQSRYLSDSGRLFFDSHDALAPQDVNGTWDVYEYEPEGVPESDRACTSAAQSGSDVFRPARSVDVEGRTVQEGAGCVGLISSGTSTEASAFVAASETGGDVFFLTTSKLAPQDFDTSDDLYDAHECTAEAPCVSPPTQPPPCATEASCKPAPTPQPGIFGPGGSATFSGAGNPAPAPAPAKAKTVAQIRAERLAKALKACRSKRNRHNRVVCEAQARKRYGPAHKAKKSSHRRSSQ